MDRELPHDLEAERSLLGAMLIDKDACADVITVALPQDFYYDSHKLIFEAMKSLYDEDKPIDVTTITTFLLDNRNLDRIGGVDYLLKLSESVPTTAHTQYYLQILNEKALLRRLIQESTEIVTKSYGEIGNINDFINDVEKSFLDVTRDRNAGEFKDIKSVVDEVTERIIQIQKNPLNVVGVETGFKKLDELTAGLQKGDLIIIAARPSVGKTAFALNIAYNTSFKSDEAVAVFSLEMPASQLVSRLMCCSGGINNDDLRTGQIFKKSQHSYYSAADKLLKCQLYIDDSSTIKVGEIAAKCRRLKRERGLKLVIIDYLQLISGPTNSRESRQQEVSDISRQLKALARELQCPVIALSQLSRSVEQRKDNRPVLSDLRESGAIEQDADIVAFLHREDYQNKEKEEDTHGIVELLVKKHRNGATDDIQLVFEKEFSRFSNLTLQKPVEAMKDVR